MLLFDTVKNLCQSQKITVAQLERKVKIGNGSIRKWNKAFPSADRLAKVADYFGVSTDFLLGRGTTSTQGQELLGKIEELPPQKRDLVVRYVEMLKTE